MTRQAQFQIALTSAGIEAQDFAGRIGINHSTLSLVLHSHRKSRRITREIDRFIAREFKKLKIAVPHSTEGGPNDNNPVPTRPATRRGNSGAE